MIKIIKTDSRNSDFIELVRQLDAYLATTDGEEHAFYDQFNKIDKLEHVMVAYENGIAVGCGAIKEYAPSMMEVKRMYTSPTCRRKGVAGKVLDALEQWAAELGYEKCILETGRRQVEAVQFYPKKGYQVISNYGQYINMANSVCFEKKVHALSVREMQQDDVRLVVDYFFHADENYLKGMGAIKNKLPSRNEWMDNLYAELELPYEQKGYYYIMWLINGQPSGHSNINQISFGQRANMHLHLWHNPNRQKGLGSSFLNKTIPHYFKNFNLQTLICEPYALNPAPNRTLPKLGFDFIHAYETIPGTINFHQLVNRYELTSEQFSTRKLV